MLSTTPVCFRHINYKQRLKTRMVGFIPRFVPRKAKNSMCALRSEANSSYFVSIFKSDAERLDTTGRKLQRIEYDEHIGRYCVFKEAKVKGPFLTKSHINLKPAPLPWINASQKK